jgi:hypothetical protein
MSQSTASESILSGSTRQYIFTEEQTRQMFIGAGVLMISTLVGILLLASSRPQGKFVHPDRTTLLNTVNAASETLESYHLHEDGSVSIPIERAIDLVTERGVSKAFGE